MTASVTRWIQVVGLTVVVSLAHIRVSVAAGVNWSTLTASSLSQLSPADVTLAQDADIAALPSAACSGWTAKLISSIGSSTSGSDPNENPSHQCGFFSPACIQQIPADAFSGAQISCAQSFLAPQLGVMTASQFAAIPPDSLNSFSKLQIAALAPAACAGITPEQAGQFENNAPHDTCTGITVACMQQLTPAAMNGMRCVVDFSDAVIAAITPVQMAQVVGMQFGEWTAQQLALLKPPVCAAITSSQLSSVGNMRFDACSGISTACWSAVSPAALTGLRSSCVQYATGDMFSQFTAAQWSKVAGPPLNQMTAPQMASLSLAACGVMVPEQLEPLNSQVCGSFRSDCMAALPPASCSGLTAEFGCIGAIPAEGFGVVNAQCIASITPGSFGDLPGDGLRLMKASCAGISADQLASYGSYAAFKPQCIRNVAPASFVGLNSYLKDFPMNTVRALTMAQIQQVVGGEFQFWTLDQFHTLFTKFGQGFIDGLTAAQGNGFSFGVQGVIADLEASVASGKVPEAEPVWLPGSNANLANKSLLQLLTCPVQCMSALFASSSSANTLPVLSWLGLRTDHVLVLTPAMISTLTNVHSWASWPATAIAALNANQVAAIDEDSFFAMKWNSINSEAVAGITEDQIENLDLISLGHMTCPLYTHLSADQVSWIAGMSTSIAADLLSSCGPATGPAPIVPVVPVIPPSA